MVNQSAFVIPRGDAWKLSPGHSPYRLAAKRCQPIPTPLRSDDEPNGNTTIDIELTNHCTVLLGSQNGKYPDANGILVRGTQRTALIDPALGVAARKERMPHVDLVLLSHCHEDHFLGLADYPTAECLGSRIGADLPAIAGRSAGYVWCLRRVARRNSPWMSADVQLCASARCSSLSVTVTSGIWAESRFVPSTRRAIPLAIACSTSQPDDVLFLADIDLSSFGPFYGDADSSIDDFERSIEQASKIKAAHYVTAHHKGIVDPGRSKN